MPTYEYRCKKCKKKFFVEQSIISNKLVNHWENGQSKCLGEIERLIAPPALKFNGSGFYVNDYGKGKKHE